MKERVYGLDVLRCLAIILVLIQHAGCVVTESALQASFFGVIAVGGWAGVDLFFVLSGYLISGLILDEVDRTGSFDGRSFFIRRGLKIYPPYYLFLFSTLLAWIIFKDKYFSIYQIIGEILFIQNYTGASWAHTWSLAVEEHFYIFICLLVVSCCKFSWNVRSVLAFTAVALVLLCCFLRVINFDNHEITSLTHRFPTHLRIDSLFVGVLVRLNHKYINLFKSNISSILCFFMAVLCFIPFFGWEFVKNQWIFTYGFTVLSLGSAFAVISCLQWRVSERFKFLVVIGQSSYAIYLWHMFVGGFLCNRILGSVENTNVRVVVYIVLSVLFGIVMTRALEIPVLRLRDRFFPAK